MTSPDALMDFDWSVLDDLHGSDHFPIILSNGDSIPVSRASRWCTERANWSLFKELSHIELDCSELPTIEEAVFYLNSIYINAGKQSIPKTTGRFHRRPVPWWNVQCRLRHRAMRAAFTRYRRHRCAHYLISFKKARARFRYQIKQARRESWVLFLSNITWKTPMTLVWAKIKKIAGKFKPSPPPVLKVNGSLTFDPKTVSNIFAEHFAKVSSKNENAPYYRESLRQEFKYLDFTARKTESYNDPFSMKEFLAALSSSKNTAPGPDDIIYDMIRNSSFTTKKFILSIFNRIFKFSDFPNIWEIAFVLPFLKPGKDSSIPASYRPIALTSCLCKLLERMVNTRLVWFLERKQIISSSQCGFRRMRSCTDILIRLEDSICKAFVSKQHHITVFFDLEKAYDTAWRYGILKVLHDIGLRGELPLFIKVFLRNRPFRVRIGNTLSDLKMQEEGVPQGSDLSVTLFALSINGIASVIPVDVMFTLFVDDLSLSFAASRMSVAERKLQLTIDKIVDWAAKHGFRFSTSKTVAMHFCRLRGVHPDPDLYLYGQRISCVEETRFLGLIFDSRLTWDSHIKNLKMKCMKSIDILKVLSHTRWGADRQHLLHLHRALVVSKLSYGSEIYSSATAARLNALNAIHHSGVRIATGAFRSSPIPSLLVDAGEYPLDIIRQTCMVKYWVRVQRLPESLTYEVIFKSNFSMFENKTSYPKPFSFRVRNILDDLEIPKGKVLPARYSAFPPWKLPNVEYCKCLVNTKKNTPDYIIRQKFLCHLDDHSDSVFIFTDGSKSSAGVGFGVVFPDFNHSGALPRHASVFTSEVFSILFTLKRIVNHRELNFTIFSDSQSVLESLSAFNPSHPMILEILEWIFLLGCKQKTVKFCWVPAHVGIAGNELADQLAKEGTYKNPISQTLPASDFVPSIRSTFKSMWQFLWTLELSNKMRQITDIIYPWKYKYNNRRIETTLCRLRIGHTQFSHGFLMNNDFQPFCDECLVPLTVKHLLIECPSLVELREQYFNRDRDGNFSLKSILGENVDVDSLFNFIEKAGFLSEI